MPTGLEAVIDCDIAKLRFPYDARHALTNEPLRLWVKTLPARRWDPKDKVWIVEVDLIEPGVLKAAGFQAVDTNGYLVKRSSLTSEKRTSQDVDIPDWFGLELADYQREGATQVARGMRLLADAPGVGKTRQALAAAAALRSQRTLILAPPTVLSHWEYETTASGLDIHSGSESYQKSSPRDMTDGSEPLSSIERRIEVVRAERRKAVVLPDSGVVIASDTTVTARPGLADQLRAWHPTVFILDEAHRAKTWSSKRSICVRGIGRSSDVTIALSGTPLFANPVEMTPLLDLTGDLMSVFGGRHQFIARYARQNKWNAWIPRRENLPELRSSLDEHVWVRRTKDDVMPSLPAKSRRSMIIDVDPKLFNAAHTDVIAKVDAWIAQCLRDTGVLPTRQEAKAWSRGNLGCISQLRKAAGLSKIPAMSDMITEWVSSQIADRSGITHPLVIWTHHREVTDGLSKACDAAVRKIAGLRFTTPCGVIAGDVPQNQRTDLIADFQDGRIPVMVCSITAAGLGITLTRSSDVIFAETDWTPALIQQAEDRCHRIGQDNHVTITTLIAPNTLDEKIQEVLLRKSKVLDAILGGDNNVSTDTHSSPGASILEAIVFERLRAANHRTPTTRPLSDLSKPGSLVRNGKADAKRY